MKKTMKYAGIAAVSIIALSPVIVNTVSNNFITNVEADDRYTNEDDFNEARFVYPGSITVEQGSSVSAVKLNENDFKLIQVDGSEENKGKEVPTLKKVGTDGKFYGRREDIPSDSLNLGTHFNVKLGTVYRLIYTEFEGTAAKFIEDVGDIHNNTRKLDNLEFGTVFTSHGGNLYDGDGGVGFRYIQEIHITPKSNTNTPKPEVISGIITTNTDQSKYSIYDDNNSDAEHRSLVTNSSWRTDRVRTIDGVKQYRVSTHGWVNASDVTYIPDGDMHSRLIITPLNAPIKVHVSDEHPYHSLQLVDRDFVTHRALDRGTTWVVDKIGTDIHGRIYYGVSTNEFIHNSYGVSVVK